MNATRGLVLFTILASRITAAHFYLVEPAASLQQNNLGDPQKAPPCGQNATSVATNAVTTFQAGQTITVRIRETIFHPGHYRVAIGMNGAQDLPAPPPVTPGNTPQNMTPCGTTVIQNPPMFPVLADGALVHTNAFPNQAQSFQVKLPNMPCTNCTLQVIQFMSNHGLNNPGGCYYHHCANIRIVSDGGAMPMADAGKGDAGGTIPDAGVSPGTPDANMPMAMADASMPSVDAGEPDDDGHSHDHGNKPDASTIPIDPPVGCGCSGSPSIFMVSLFGALWAMRARRKSA